MNGYAKLKRITAILLAAILVLSVNPIDAEDDPGRRHTYYSDWWKPALVLVTADYTFSDVGDTVLLPYLLSMNGIYGNVTEASLDSEAVQLDESLYLTAVDYFDSVTLTVTVREKTYTFILHNPGNATVIPAGEEVTGESGSFTATGEIPAGTALVVGTFEPTEALVAAIPAEEENAVTVWLDIGLQSPDGEDVHTGAEVSVNTQIELPAAPEVSGLASRAVIKNAHLYHVTGESEVEELPVEVDTEGGYITALHFSTEGFSGFALSYTVDFEYTVDGETYEFSLPGGGFITLHQLAGALGIGTEDTDAAEQFLAGVESVTFSDPSLVWVGQAQEDTTVGQLKSAHELVCEYSAELTEKQIAKIDGSPVPAGEWLLISLKPFLTEETLTVTMKSGEAWTVKVTDGQIKKMVIDAKGDTWEITVTYDDDAMIPKGAGLQAREILEGTAEYESCYELTIKALNENHSEEGYLAGLTFAKFFDVDIIDENGQKIEPATPVTVEIRYVDPIEVAGNDSLKVIHFAEAETEIIPIETTEGPITEIVYEQNGFSVIGTVAETNAYGWPTVANTPYVMLLQDGNTYYAVAHDGTLREVYYLNGTVAFMGPGTTELDYLNQYLWNYSVVSSTRHTGRLSSYGTDTTYYIDPYNGLLPQNAQTPDAVIGTAQRTLSISNGKIYSTYYGTSYSLSAEGGTLHRTTLDAEDASPIFFADFESFTADPSESELYDFIDISVLINKWKGEMTQDLVVDKTAEVYDYKNRIYQVDLMASSGYHMISPALALEFVVDASRSMFFPENLHRVQVNGNDVTYSSMNGLRTFFNGLDSSQRDNVYYVITDKNGAATNWAIFYHDASKLTVYKSGSAMASGWYYVDASCYYAPDNYERNYPGTGNYCYALGSSTLNNLNDGYIYTADERVPGRPWSRLDYMQIAVEAAAKVLYAVDPDAQIGLVAFNKKTASYGPFVSSQENQLISALYSIALDGGTRHADGLNKAISEFNSEFSNVNNCQTAVVLITDGAPNGNTWAEIRTAATNVKAMTNAFGQNTRLFTLGLSLENVGSSADELYNISSTPHSDFAFSAEQSTEVVHFITKIIEGLTIDANLTGNVTDVIDAGFYPVNPATGLPLTSGTWLTEEGTVTTAGAADAVGQVLNVNGTWKVEWQNQRIDWPTYTDSTKTKIDTHGWNGRVYVKAQEDFLGGNDIETNGEGSQVEALQYINPRTGEVVTISNSDAEKVKAFQTPYVNVDELLFDEHSTEWTVYLGESVDPKTQLQRLIDTINVYEVVKDNGSLVYTLSPQSVDNLASSGKSRTGKTFPLSDVVGDVTEAQWNALIVGESVEIDYEAYGHVPGAITLSLKQTVVEGEEDLLPSPHATTVTGDAVEKYELTVEYIPFAPSVANYHTGQKGTGSHGADTDNIVSENTHTINVYAKPLEIEKTDPEGNPLPGAAFKLYMEDDENGTAIEELNTGHNYVEVAAAVSGSNGIARLKQGGEDYELVLGKTYYLVETAAPKYYAGDSTLWKAEVQAEDGKYTDLTGTAISGKEYPFNWDQDARGVVNEAPAAVIAQGETEGATVTITNSSYVPHGQVITFRYTVINDPLETELPIPVKKILKGRDMKANEFSFVLQPISIEGVRSAPAQTIYNPAGLENEEVTFNFTLDYSTEDALNAPYNDEDGNAVFYYVVYEEQGNAEGVIYSELQYIVRVTLTQDGDSLVATPRYYPYAGEGPLSDEMKVNLQLTAQMTAKTGSFPALISGRQAQ